jgi:hypothetical protein
MMKSGEYIVCDLCYVLNDENVWYEVCDKTFNKDLQSINGEFTLNDGRKFVLYSTKFGDGLYHDQYGNEYPVDSGTIGCIALDDVKNLDKVDKRLYNVFTFTEDFDTGCDKEGTIHFGSVVIHTWGEEEYE